MQIIKSHVTFNKYTKTNIRKGNLCDSLKRKGISFYKFPFSCFSKNGTLAYINTLLVLVEKSKFSILLLLLFLFFIHEHDDAVLFSIQRALIANACKSLD